MFPDQTPVGLASWIIVALGIMTVCLSMAGKPPLSPDMGNIATKTKPSPAARRTHRAAQARRRRAEDRSDCVIAVKRCADIDAGRVTPLTRQEFLRALDLRG